MPKKCPYNQSYGFSSSHMVSTVALEKIPESPLDLKEIKPVTLKGNQLWIFIGRTDAEAEAPILWPPDAKRWLIGRDPDAGKDWEQEEKRATEDEMAGCYHRHEFEQTPGDSKGQVSLACCSPWGHKESEKTEWRTRLRAVPSGQQLAGLSWGIRAKSRWSSAALTGGIGSQVGGLGKQLGTLFPYNWKLLKLGGLGCPCFAEQCWFSDAFSICTSWRAEIREASHPSFA